MVYGASCFGNPDAPTPHGGPVFHGWKNGWGFGKSLGAGGFLRDKSIPKQLDVTPAGERGFSSSAFWRTKYEVGPSSSFGIGDRPSLYRKQEYNLAPDHYGDVTHCLDATKRNQIKKDIKLKPRFPSMEEKYRDNSFPQSGPGPSYYNTCMPTGQSSWSNPSKVPSYGMGLRLESNELKYTMDLPGPPGPDGIRTACGRNSPIIHGTLYDITMKGRINHHDIAGGISPGPAKYTVKGKMDSYGLGDKIKRTKVPKGPPPEIKQLQRTLNKSGMKTTTGSMGTLLGSPVPPSPVAEKAHTLTRCSTAP